MSVKEKCNICFISYLCISTIVFAVADSRGVRKCTYFLFPFGHTYSLTAFHITTIVIVETQMWDKASRDCRLICEQLPTLLHQVVSRMGATGDRQRPRLSQSQGYKGRSGTSIMRHSELYSSCMQFSVMHRQRNRRYRDICTSELSVIRNTEIEWFNLLC